nr:putative cytosolic NADP isocitrate dehydrogenase [Tanacetum cinerariifolium]
MIWRWHGRCSVKCLKIKVRAYGEDGTHSLQKHPQTGTRHAFGDQYKATDAVIKGLEKLKMVFVPEGGGEITDLEVYNFTVAGGVALSM